MGDECESRELIRAGEDIGKVHVRGQSTHGHTEDQDVFVLESDRVSETQPWLTG